jgi:hypothetical protein
MPQLPVVFPDVEDLVREYLVEQLPLYGYEDIPVHISIPAERPEAFVTVPRVGGPRRNLVVDAATVSVDSWHQTPKQAQDLAQVVRGLVNALPGRILDGYPVYKVEEFAGPGNLPDNLSAHSRYTATYSVHIRGFSMEPVI